MKFPSFLKCVSFFIPKILDFENVSISIIYLSWNHKSNSKKLDIIITESEAIDAF